MENIVYQNKDGIEYIQFKKLLEYPEITHCYTMRNNNELNFQIKNRDFFKQSCDKILKSLNLKKCTNCKAIPNPYRYSRKKSKK